MINNTHTCPVCGQPLHTYPSDGVLIGTCVLDATCSRKGITLEVGKLLTLTDEQAAEYNVLKWQREDDEYAARLAAEQRDRAERYLAVYGKPMPGMAG